MRPVTVRWRVMSLSVLCGHRRDDPEGEWEGHVWAPVRVCAAAEDRFGRRALGEIFTAVGTRFHLPGDRGNLTGGTGRRRAAAGDRGGRRFHRLRRGGPVLARAGRRREPRFEPADAG